jgi:transposase
VPTVFLEGCCQEAAARDKTALLLVGDNASWHGSKAVRSWLRDHNRAVKQTGQGVRLLRSPLPPKSPWLNPIEPPWGHTKRRIVESDRLPPARELAQRVCAAVDCPHHTHIPIPEQVT